MPQEVLRVGVLAIRRPPVTRWGTGELRPSAVLPQEPPIAPGTLITAQGGAETWYLGARDLMLYQGSTGYHRDNLESGQPSVWVALRGGDPKTVEIACVTADPYEGEGLTTDLSLLVEAVPMPPAIAQAVAAFVGTHHIDLPFTRRKRQPVDPNTMSVRGPRILQDGDKWVKDPHRK